jgi:tRNA (guanosine-2'-O-)-methyltransferase
VKRDLPEVVPLASTDATLPASPDVVIAALGPLVSDLRRERIERVLASRTRSVIPVLERLADPHNTAAVVRSADALGAQEVHVVEARDGFVASARVAKSAERWLDLVRHDTVARCAEALHGRGYRLLVAALDGEVLPADLAAIPRVAIVFGNEHDGVSAEVRAVADGAFRIPMRGFVDSLNVSVAAAITLHAALAGRAGDLDDADKLRLRARWYLQSVERAGEIVEEHVRRRL